MAPGTPVVFWRNGIWQIGWKLGLGGDEARCPVAWTENGYMMTKYVDKVFTLDQVTAELLQSQPSSTP